MESRQRRSGRAGRGAPSGSGVEPGQAARLRAPRILGKAAGAPPRRRAALERPGAGPQGGLVPSCHRDQPQAQKLREGSVREEQKAAGPRRTGAREAPPGSEAAPASPRSSSRSTRTGQCLNPGNRQLRGGRRAFPGAPGPSVDAFWPFIALGGKESLLKSPRGS